MSKNFIVETSARHVHVTTEALETLFGKGYQLTKKKDLSQPGQFLLGSIFSLLGSVFRLLGSVFRLLGSIFLLLGSIFSLLGSAPNTGGELIPVFIVNKINMTILCHNPWNP